MENPIVILDTCDYEVSEHGTCVLRGWLYFEDESDLQVQVRADHMAVECSMTRKERPDVLAARPDLFSGEALPGYEIRIPNLEQIFSLAESLRVRIWCEHESFPLLQISMEEIKQKYCQSTIRYHMEVMERRKENVYLQGYCINTWGELEIKVEDKKGRAVEIVHTEKNHRMDLSQHFGVELSQTCGFMMEIPRKNIRGRELQLVFQNRITEKREIIDMQKFDMENTELGRVVKAITGEKKEENREILKEVGFRKFLDFVKEEHTTSFQEMYAYYEKRQRVSGKEYLRQKKEVFSPSLLFSIVVPLYHTPIKYLKELIDSVVRQSYVNWELCFADGSNDDVVEKYIASHYGREKRIRYQRLEKNMGIAGNTNAALHMATGDCIVFADHDDTLALDALYLAACVFRDHPETEFIYTDEDLTDENGNSTYPHFKPDFNLDYLRCINYICHLVVVRRSLWEQVGDLRSECDGAQDYDFVLRCVEKTKHIYHIPKILYHWRSHPQSTAGNQGNKHYAIDAGKLALEEHYKRMNLEGEVEFTGLFIVYRTTFKISGNPKVSILIPNKDHIEDLETCISSICEKSTWENKEIIVIENNSEEKRTFAYYETLQERYDNVRVVYWEGEFNYSAINNFGTTYATGEYLLLLNNDTEVITPDWLERMLSYCQREEVGIVGAKLFYPDNLVQHAGVVIGMGGFAGHIQTGYEMDYPGYMGRLKTAQEISAVTGACLMVKKEVYEAVKGLDENFAVALNDVDFCLRVRELGKLVIFQPDAQLYHYESKSRGFETTPEKKARFAKEIERFQKRHSELLEKGDPYYNPNLSLTHGDCSLRKVREQMKGRK